MGELAPVAPPDAGLAFLQVAKSFPATSGYHNRNHVVSLTEAAAALVGREPGTRVTVRIPRADALPVVIRTWRREAEILRAVRGALPHVPECLLEGEGFAVHSYVEGVPLSSVCGNGKPLDSLILQALAELLAQMTRVRLRALPALPEGWPGNHTDSQGFLRMLALLADRQVRQPNWHAFGGLFAALGIPEDALLRLADRVPPMSRRPFSLLHADLHRDNLIMSYEGAPPLICVDWELATFGDPLHDLATHLVRMQYPAHQWPEVIEAWRVAMARVRPAAVNGLAKDLRHYVAFERAQSVYPDIMRAARTLEAKSDRKSLDDATAAVRRALRVAAEPLRLGRLPSDREIQGALLRWRASNRTRSGSCGERVFDWSPDKRLGVHADFPEEAVTAALRQEGRAPAGRVFMGTAHLNSVVSVPGVGFPVVVRRRVATVCRREPSFLSEHAVLRAIEESGVAVAAPRVLALGESHEEEPFAIHTYVGSNGADGAPRHPIHGLLPHEADSLVDQLCALTDVDYKKIDPAAGEGGFYEWLSGQLVLLVRNLPKDSQQIARVLGLPDAHRLREILAGHHVGERVPVLLHGDLNPWNLVRRGGPRALTIIDWEMALVGDPLYDMVRHMHLTPTLPEIQRRMFQRWERLLPARHTRAWRRDSAVYRGLEVVRSAYIDLDRLVTGASLDAPNVRRAVDSYAMTLEKAMGFLGLPARPTANPYLARAFDLAGTFD
ncbi:phosphotransferase enzyme family protein [Streptomyces mangrovisoli]|uniref:Phosphotransferase enzyme family protein n=1 Tax=Streptomyces mangrovisoli TaxID=1428628 RepID=A0A1J4NR93_9ACTN|nr:phosphotransferase enzyme family protein [Streptomyces mangrovisoli]